MFVGNGGEFLEEFPEDDGAVDGVLGADLEHGGRRRLIGRRGTGTGL